MLLVLLPVGVLLGFTIVDSASDWRTASSLRDFRGATKQSFVVGDIVTALGDERAAATLAILRPGDTTRHELAAAESRVNTVLAHGSRGAAAWHGPVDLGGRLDATRRQLNAVRVQVTGGTLTAPDVADEYSSIVRGLVGTIRELDAAGPTRRSARAADAYVAITQAIEAAQRERVDVATLLADSDRAATTTAARWAVLETAELDVFRANAAGRLTADLNAVLFSAAGVTVTGVRDDLAGNALDSVRAMSLSRWLDASGTRIASLRAIQDGARGALAAAASGDLSSAQARGLSDLGISLAVLLLVGGLALALRRSITRPLAEVSHGARSLSTGDLTADVGYRGRDEIGQVASAFRDLHLTVERLAGEVRRMTAAVKDNRLGHRADVAAFEGTWSSLLVGLNDTMAAFADLEGRRERAERELSDFFELSADMLCIANLSGYFTRVNPAFERTLGYPTAELLSRPFLEFIYRDDRERTRQALGALRAGRDVLEFENRYVRGDGSVRWLEWSALPVDGLVYAVARDVTQRRRSEDEQAALHRIATLVAQGAAPQDTFSAVAAEVGQLVDADIAAVFRYEPQQTATLVGEWSGPPVELPIGKRLVVSGAGIVARVYHTRRPARMERFEGPPGSVADFLARRGARSGVGAPITVEGRLWGVLIVTAGPDRLPAGSELSIAEFTDLLATAVGNAEARKELRRVADEQAALRRVATLVAEGARPGAVFAMVAEEAGRLLDSDLTTVARYSPDDTVTVLAASSADGETPPIGARRPLSDARMSKLVHDTARPARIHRPASDAAGAELEFGIRSAVGAPITVAGRLWGLLSVASTTDDAPPHDTEARLADFTELVATAIANAEAQAELSASRARIVATADQTRRRFERDLHDGAQQQLISLALEVRAAQAAVPPHLGELAAELDRVADGLIATIDELREFARGIHPAMLSEGGLRPALRTLARRSVVPVELNIGAEGRLPERVEVAAYYVVSEALANAAKHAQASTVAVDVQADDGVLRVSVRDDGVGGADFGAGSGLVGLKDRVEALGGHITLRSEQGRGTSVSVELPVGDDAADIEVPPRP